MSNKEKEIANWITDIQKDIENKTVFEITKNRINNLKNKGSIGNHIQAFYFNIPVNSRREPDFLEKNIELKVTPMIRNKNDCFRSKERLVFGLISYSKIIHEEDFYISSFMKKNQNILIIFYEYKQGKDLNEFKIIKVNLLNLLNLNEIKQIEEEYKFIVNKIILGEAHLISSSDTNILEACTKGSKGNSDSKQPNSIEIAKSRAFAFKSRFITQLYYRAAEIKFDDNYKTIDDVISKINKYKGYSIKQIENLLGNTNDSKNNRFYLVKKILNVIKIDYIKPIINENIIIKTVNLEENFSLKEHIPLCRVELDDMDEESMFEDSNFYDIVVNRKILFVFFKKIRNDSILLGTKMFKFPTKSINEAREIYLNTKRLFNNGGAIKRNENENNQYYFKKANNIDCFHIRPGAINANDCYITNANEKIIKQKYWLNKNIVVNLYKEYK